MRLVLFFSLILFVGIFLASCEWRDSKDESQSENVEEAFDYEKFYKMFEDQVKEDISFNEIVKNFYYDPENFRDTTIDKFPYSLNKVNLFLLKSFFDDSEEVSYHWNEDILKTKYSSYIDTVNCDCNLVVESNLGRDYVPICFYREKIYSIAGLSGDKPGNIVWEGR